LRDLGVVDCSISAVWPVNGEDMQKPALVPNEHREDVQRFLFACSFWTVAADEKLTQGEQNWLAEQFGAGKSVPWLREMAAEDGDRFFRMFDKLAKSLTDSDKRKIYPMLTGWLLSCAQTDGPETSSEQSVIAQIGRRLSLDSELRRLENAAKPRPVPPAAAAHSMAVPAAVSAAVPAAAEDCVSGRLFRGHSRPVLAACFDSTGRFLFSGSEDGTIRSWDTSASVETRTFETQDAAVTAVVASPVSAHVYSGNAAGSVFKWNAGNGARVWRTNVDPQSAVSGISITSDGRLVIACLEGGTLMAFEAGTGTQLKDLGSCGITVRDVACSPAGQFVVSGSDDGVLRIADCETGAVIRTMAGHGGPALAVAFSSDGRRVVSGSRDKTVRLWDASTGKELRSFTGHSAEVRGVIISLDRERVLSSSRDGTVRMWNIESGASAVRYRIPSGELHRVALHPAGRDVACCCSDNCLHYLENAL